MTNREMHNGVEFSVDGECPRCDDTAAVSHRPFTRLLLFSSTACSGIQLLETLPQCISFISCLPRRHAPSGMMSLCPFACLLYGSASMPYPSLRVPALAGPSFSRVALLSYGRPSAAETFRHGDTYCTDVHCAQAVVALCYLGGMEDVPVWPFHQKGSGGPAVIRPTKCNLCSTEQCNLCSTEQNAGIVGMQGHCQECPGNKGGLVKNTSLLSFGTDHDGQHACPARSWRTCGRRVPYSWKRGPVRSCLVSAARAPIGGLYAVERRYERYLTGCACLTAAYQIASSSTQ
jgi:hypothetical protein